MTNWGCELITEVCSLQFNHLTKNSSLSAQPNSQTANSGVKAVSETILVVNAGSSSIKFQLFAIAGSHFEMGREREKSRLGGCAGIPKLTCLSLQFWEMQGDFAKLQGQRRLIPAEGPRISMGWIGLSLILGAGRPSFHSREGRFRNTAPVFFGDIHAVQFNVRFRAPFGHRSMAR